jgi:C4-dicarboxylate transporter DctQ subunit
MKSIIAISKKLRNLASKVAKLIIIFMMAVMSVVIIIQVYVRYVVKGSFPWSEELARYLMAWVAFLGSSLGIETGAHVGVELFVNLLPKRLRIGVKVIIKLAMLAFLAAAIKESYSLCLGVASQLSPALMIPMVWPYLSVPVGCVFMFIQLLPSFLEDLSDLVGTSIVVKPGRVAEDHL